MNVDPRASQFKTTLPPIDIAQPAKIFLPSPAPQGLGMMRSRSARPVAHPAALPSCNCTSCADPASKKARETEQIGSPTHKSNEPMEKYT
jgi:hypothetical protein